MVDPAAHIEQVTTALESRMPESCCSPTVKPQVCFSVLEVLLLASGVGTAFLKAGLEKKERMGGRGAEKGRAQGYEMEGKGMENSSGTVLERACQCEDRR